MMFTMAEAATFHLLFALMSSPFCSRHSGITWSPNVPPLLLWRTILVITGCSILPTCATHKTTTLSSPLELALVSTFNASPCPPPLSWCPLHCHAWCLIVVEGGRQQREAGHRQWHNSGVDLMMGVGKKGLHSHPLPITITKGRSYLL